MHASHCSRRTAAPAGSRTHTTHAPGSMNSSGTMPSRQPIATPAAAPINYRKGKGAWRAAARVQSSGGQAAPLASHACRARRGKRRRHAAHLRRAEGDRLLLQHAEPRGAVDAFEVLLNGVRGTHAHHISHHVAQPRARQHCSRAAAGRAVMLAGAGCRRARQPGDSWACRHHKPRKQVSSRHVTGEGGRTREAHLGAKQVVNLLARH